MTATIAAEMGEAVHGDAHYGVLFILGIVLFVVTCSINVAADLIIKGVKKANKAWRPAKERYSISTDFSCRCFS